VTLRVNQLSFAAEPNPSEDRIKEHLAKFLGLGPSEITSFTTRKKSIDARNKRNIKFIVQVDFATNDEAALLSSHKDLVVIAPQVRTAEPLEGLDLKNRRLRTRPIIVGSGPAGIFAALVLSEAGQRPIVIERGEAVEKRLRTVTNLQRSGEFNGESNYCFGEGGAGTFSDGKLTCGRNHPLVRYLFETWVRFGAPADILYEAHAHIGTDNLMKIAINQRKYLESLGCEFVFGRRLVDWQPQQTGARHQITLDDGSKLETDFLVLAIGHSARDTYKMLLDRGLPLAQKPFAIGARLEHPQATIDKIQFGSCAFLPAAEYKLAAQEGERGIWTFCMCPGGLLLPTGAQAGHLAINGMSYHARNSGFANAAIVVNVRREDFDRGHPLDGMEFQADIERKSFEAGGGTYHAPAQRLVDFLKNRPSKGELVSSYKPGINPARLDQILPPFVVESLRSAFYNYEKKMHGYINDEALVVGTETKTSSPIVMPRGPGLESTSFPGFFPTGEGAGFAGGIVSAALDGTRVGRAVLEAACAEASTYLV
jgi:uncharacterized FAD-dependent dehydrogenase